MKKLLPFFLGILLLGCKSEQDVDPASGQTFIRYYGSENSQTAVLADAADGGYTLLSNIKIATDNFGSYAYKFKLTHTDLFGNTIKETKFPKSSFVTSGRGGMTASSFIVLNEGYLIIGTSINEQGTSSLFLLETTFEGDSVRSTTVELNGASLEGRAVEKYGDTHYLVLGNITSNTVEDMYLGKVTVDFSKWEWTRQYGDGKSTVNNRVFLTDEVDKNILWAGSVVGLSSEKSEMRLIKAPEDSELPNYGNPVSDLDQNQTSSDVCRNGNNYAVIGSIVDAETQDNNIFFARAMIVNNNITIVDVAEIKEEANGNRKEEGISITPAHEGGYLIFGNIETGTTMGNGRDDYYLLKVSAFGNKEWSLNYGGSDLEKAASIRKVDGGYLLFGTTSFGNIDKTMLMKVNAEGKL